MRGCCWLLRVEDCEEVHNTVFLDMPYVGNILDKVENVLPLRNDIN
jgi:hypothetical protein